MGRGLINWPASSGLESCQAPGESQGELLQVPAGQRVRGPADTCSHSGVGPAGLEGDWSAEAWGGARARWGPGQ